MTGAFNPDLIKDGSVLIAHEDRTARHPHTATSLTLVRRGDFEYRVRTHSEANPGGYEYHDIRIDAFVLWSDGYVQPAVLNNDGQFALVAIEGAEPGKIVRVI